MTTQRSIYHRPAMYGEADPNWDADALTVEAAGYGRRAYTYAGFFMVVPTILGTILLYAQPGTEVVAYPSSEAKVLLYTQPSADVQIEGA